VLLGVRGVGRGVDRVGGMLSAVLHPQQWVIPSVLFRRRRRSNRVPGRSSVHRCVPHAALSHEGDMTTTSQTWNCGIRRSPSTLPIPAPQCDTTGLTKASGHLASTAINAETLSRWADALPSDPGPASTTVHKKGARPNGRGPSRGNEPVLIPMYA
jgi:hypothetical protein